MKNMDNMSKKRKSETCPGEGSSVYIVSSRRLIRDLHRRMGELIEDERIIMTPRKKTARSTIISMERKLVEDENGAAGGKVFVAGGSHKGLIINKETTSAIPDNTPPKLTLEFRVFLVSATTKEHTQESRTLWFWFKSGLSPAEEACSAQEFFKELVSPVEFPRDYVGFIKKIMKLMQNKYRQLRRVEVELKQLDEYEKYSMILPLTDYEADNLVEVTEARVLEIIESSFPNPISVTQIASQTKSDPRRVSELLTGLQDRGTVTTVAPDTYTRATKNEDNVKIVRQMPRIVRSQQPTVAIITAQYCEKLAVDSMIDDLETFVRFNTVGESNVYSLGTIGHHRVVATKLPSVGHTREAMIAAGNTTTRLLGTFQKVEHVFLVGVGGGVPHYTDYSRHIRLGDVVVSAPISDKRFIYMYCEKSKSKLDDTGSDQEENIQVETKTWCPPMLELQELAARLKDQTTDSSSNEWQHYMKEGMERLSDQEMSFARPPPDSDKLYMSIGGSDVIEVAHPASKNEEKRSKTTPRIHLGPIGCGREISRNDILRQEISYSHGVLAYDCEFDQVLESIYGNRKDNYVVIRGVSDYADGTGCRGNLKEWQPYASLVASSVMKAMICAMPSPVEE